jgi:hypothetical protein
MKRIIPSSQFHLFCSSIPSSMALALCIVFLSSLNSCDTGSGGRYKFHSESMCWLQFRGPNSLGIAPDDANPPIQFNADTNLLWKTEILPGWSSPCIVDDKIFLTGFNKADSMLHTFAGNRIYTCSFNGTVSVLSADDFNLLEQNRLNEKIGASPVAVDDVLYIRTDKHLYAFRSK